MRVLITGIEGFVAPYLAELLIANSEVYGTYLMNPERRKGINYVHMDITDYNSVASALSAISPSVIYHLAGYSSVADSWHNPELAMTVNAYGTKNILDALVALNLHPKILVVTSSDIYGKPTRLPISEAHGLNPITPYGYSRFQQEKIIANYKSLDVTVARSFSHTGVRQLPKFVCSSFAYQVARIEKGLQEPVIKHGDISLKRDFLDVRDVVKAYWLLAEKGRPHTAYNVCSGKSYSLRDILSMLLSKSSARIETMLDNAKLRPVDIPEMLGSNAKLRRETGWKPEIDFRQTLSDILEYWRNSL